MTSRETLTVESPANAALAGDSYMGEIALNLNQSGYLSQESIDQVSALQNRLYKLRVRIKALSIGAGLASITTIALYFVSRSFLPDLQLHEIDIPAQLLSKFSDLSGSSHVDGSVGSLADVADNAASMLSGLFGYALKAIGGLTIAYGVFQIYKNSSDDGEGSASTALFPIIVGFMMMFGSSFMGAVLGGDGANNLSFTESPRRQLTNSISGYIEVKGAGESELLERLHTIENSLANTKQESVLISYTIAQAIAIRNQDTSPLTKLERALLESKIKDVDDSLTKPNNAVNPQRVYALDKFIFGKPNNSVALSYEENQLSNYKEWQNIKSGSFVVSILLLAASAFLITFALMLSRRLYRVKELMLAMAKRLPVYEKADGSTERLISLAGEKNEARNTDASIWESKCQEFTEAFDDLLASAVHCRIIDADTSNMVTRYVELKWIVELLMNKRLTGNKEHVDAMKAYIFSLPGIPQNANNWSLEPVMDAMERKDLTRAMIGAYQHHRHITQMYLKNREGK